MVLKQFKKYGVTLNDFINCIHEHIALERLYRQTDRHDYAKLLSVLVKCNPTADKREIYKQWVSAIPERMFPQIELKLIGSPNYPTAFEARNLFRKVDDALKPDYADCGKTRRRFSMDTEEGGEKGAVDKKTPLPAFCRYH